MHNDYRDIRDRIPEEPTWFDEYAVPRYCKFTPRDVANIYAKTVAYVRIECQACRMKFNVAMTDSFMRPLKIDDSLHYGDPPAHGCAGDTMNCLDLRVLEAWEQPRPFLEWTRRPDLETSLPDGR